MIQHQTQHNKRLLLTLLALTLGSLFMLSACSLLDSGGSHVDGPPRDTTPVVLQVSQPGTLITTDENNSAILDYSNTADGYICVMSNLEGIVVKVLVDVAGVQYQYTIDTPGSYITIPLSQGNGIYEVGVWQNVSGDSYAAVFSQSVEVTLSDTFTPFL